MFEGKMCSNSFYNHLHNWIFVFMHWKMNALNLNHFKNALYRTLNNIYPSVVICFINIHLLNLCWCIWKIYTLLFYAGSLPYNRNTTFHACFQVCLLTWTVVVCILCLLPYCAQNFSHSLPFITISCPLYVLISFVSFQID